MLKYLLPFLFLVGCSIPDRDNYDYNPEDTSFHGFDDSIKRGQSHEIPFQGYYDVPKYKVPNEFTLKNGCIIRSDSTEAGVGGFLYNILVITNEWTDKCSTVKGDSVPESEIKKARYK